MFTALFITAKTWKHPKSPLVVERKTKMLWYICLLSASKNEETQPSEITRMKCEGITLTEMSQKGKYCMISFL